MSRLVPEAALDLIRRFEGLREKAYWDSGGKCWTVGYGHTGPDVTEGTVVTPARAEELLREDAQKAAKLVEWAVKVPLTNGEFGALVSFVFNVGPGKQGQKSGFIRLANGNPSTLLRVLNAGLYDQVPAQLARWTRAGGVVLGGLARRRAAEAALWRNTDAG